MQLAHECHPSRHLEPGIPGAIPVLTTARLALRAPELSDFSTLVAIYAEPSASNWHEMSREDVWYEFAQMTATWVLRGHGWWSIDHCGVCSGFVGVGFEPGDQAPELGYMIAPDMRGQGLATEAAGAALTFAKDANLPALVSYIDAPNTSSQNVARKLGARRDHEAEAALPDTDTQVWRHLPAATFQ